MKAAYYDRFGDARDVLTIADLATPDPAAHEVLVRVRASGVNPSDVKLRAGKRPGGAAPEMPYPLIIPHSDGAGVIEAVGADVDAARIGERVWIWNAQWARAHGTAAEYVALPADQAVTLPEPASFADGACLGIPALTAHYCLFTDGDIAGKHVLVTGAAGTVGRYAVQMAKLAGAHVLATVSGPEKAEEAHAAGADATFNYREDGLVANIMDATRGAGVDRIVEVDFGANIETTNAVLAPGGVVSAYASMAAPEPTLPFYQLMFRDVTLRLALCYRMGAAHRRRAETDLSAWLAEGRLAHRFAARVSFDEVAAAHELVEAGSKIGCVVVEI